MDRSYQYFLSWPVPKQVSGNHIPDGERWGGEWELGKNVFEKEGFMYMMSPGGHLRRTAIIFTNNFELKKDNYEMTDIYDVIMDAVRGE